MPTAGGRRQELSEETLGLMRRVLARAYEPESRGPRGTRFLSLHHLALHVALREPGATQGELAAFLGVTPSRVTAILDDLEKEGLVVRKPDLTDRRIHRLEATLRAREFHRKFHTSAGDRTATLFRGWSDQDLEALRALLVRLDPESPSRGKANAAGAPRRREPSRSERTSGVPSA